MEIQRLFLPSLSIEQKDLLGENRPFTVPSYSVKDTQKIYEKYDYTQGEYYYYDIYEIIKPMKLSTHWDGCARPFLQDKKIELPIGSYIYLIPEEHQIYRLESWTHFNVLVGE
jgi:hypothetical protein